MYYLATGRKGKDRADHAGYLAAISEWREIKRQIDQGMDSAFDGIGTPPKNMGFLSFATNYANEPDKLSDAVLDV